MCIITLLRAHDVLVSLVTAQLAEATGTIQGDTIVDQFELFPTTIINYEKNPSIQ